ncbi:MAG: 30S ribosomal protein S18 [Acidimicrobiia bacterium]
MPPRPRARRRKPGAESRRKKRVCEFCQRKNQDLAIDYKDVSLLRKYMSDRGKIRARRVTGACAMHQRKVAVAVKNAREMALLPYTTPRQQ